MSKTYPKIIDIPTYNLSVCGWSRGSQNTGFIIPELKLLLDAQSRPQFDAEFIAITHVHTDHCASLPMRLICINTNPKIFAPEESKKFLSDYINATFRMGYHDALYEHKYNLIGVRDNEIHKLKNGYQLKTYKLDHNIPCIGYGLQNTKTKLKKEFMNLPKNELIIIKKQNICITEEVTNNVLAYLTDTTHKIFENQEIMTYPYIMVECTFLQDTEKEMQLADIAHHMHWNNLYPIIKSHPENKFILIHFSNRYSDEELKNFASNVKESNVSFVI